MTFFVSRIDWKTEENIETISIRIIIIMKICFICFICFEQNNDEALILESQS